MRAGSIAGVVLALVLAAPAAAAPEQILYVGDSLGVGTTPGFAQALGSAASVHGDSRIGRPSPEGLRVLQQSFTPADDIVVFDLGTNDDPSHPAQLASDLAAARQATGSRCLVVATLNRPPLNGFPVDGLNRAVESFASSTPGVQLVDWHAEAQADPSLLGPDEVHPTPRGYALRAQLFAEAVSECGAATAAPAPAAKPRVRRPRPKRKPKPAIKVPGIESSGISFTQPLRVNGKQAQLLLPNTRGPYPAVVMVGAPESDAETVAAKGIAALALGAGAGTTDATAALALMERRRDIRRGSVALWVAGDAARNGIADHPAAVVAMQPNLLPEAELRDWRIRRALDAPAPAVTNWWRLRARSDAALRADPADHWRGVGAPVLAVWTAHDKSVPARASATALRDALRVDRTFASAANHEAATDVAARWLRRHLAGRAIPAAGTTLPPATPGQQPIDVAHASALYTPPLQALWLLVPALMLVAAALRRPGSNLGLIISALVAGVVGAAVTALGIAAVIGSDGDVGEIAGIPWPFALALLFALDLAVVTAWLFARRAWLAAAAGALWVALALFWLL